MTQAVLEQPEAPARREPGQISPRPEAPLPQKPAGITDKTWQSLALKGKRFVAEFVRDGNAARAYQVAGYIADGARMDSEKVRRNAYNVTRGRKVRTALCEYAQERDALKQAKADFALDWIVLEHQRLMAKAETKGDLAVATRNLELIGRTRGVYSDTVRLDVGRQREYSEAEQIEAARLTRILLTEGSGEQPAEVAEQEKEEPVNL